MEKERRERKREDEIDGFHWNGNEIGVEIGNGAISHQQGMEMGVPDTAYNGSVENRAGQVL